MATDPEFQDSRSPLDLAVSMNLTSVLSIRDMAPLEIAVPVYGYVLPVVVMITVVTNSFIVLVLSQPQLRTPTNCILLAMALMELLTGLASFPWMLYYYTFGGYVDDALYGMPAFWCRSSPYFAELLPTVFHTSAIWLTVYLAIQRYWFVCSTSHNRRSLVPNANLMSVNRVRIVVAVICILALLVELPMIFGKHTTPYETVEYTFCVVRISEWVLKLGPNYFFSIYYWFLVIFVHAGPCTLLVIFGGLLIQTVHGAVKRRRESLGYLLRQRDRSNSASSTSSSNLHATTKMLVVVIVIFLMTEIPAAVIFTLHVLSNTFKFLPLDSYKSMNMALILRNVFILISYPFNFAVYLSMSYQFRHTVRRLFCRDTGNTDVVANTLVHARSTHNAAEAFLLKNNLPQKRSAPLPISASYAGLADRRRYSVAENPLIGTPVNSGRRGSSASATTGGLYSDRHPRKARHENGGVSSNDASDKKSMAESDAKPSGDCSMNGVCRNDSVTRKVGFVNHV